MKERKKNSLSNIFSKQLKVSQKLHNVFLAVVIATGTFLVGGSNLKAESVGQFYWHLPSFRQNSSTELYETISLRLDSTSLGTGFHVAAGDLERPKHLADIGLFGFPTSASGGSGVLLSASNLQEFRLGYVYHYSDNYDTSEASNNVHFGVGYISSSISIFETRSNGVQLVYTSRGTGLYIRAAFFRSIPSQTKPILVGINLTVSSLNNGSATGASSTGISIPLTDSQPAALNGVDLAFVIGTSF